MVMHKLETYISRHGLSSKFNINFENEEIKVRIDRVQRDTLLHNIINIDVMSCKQLQFKIHNSKCNIEEAFQLGEKL